MYLMFLRPFGSKRAELERFLSKKNMFLCSSVKK